MRFGWYLIVVNVCGMPRRIKIGRSPISSGLKLRTICSPWRVGVKIRLSEALVARDALYIMFLPCLSSIQSEAKICLLLDSCNRNVVDVDGDKSWFEWMI